MHGQIPATTTPDMHFLTDTCCQVRSVIGTGISFWGVLMDSCMAPCHDVSLRLLAAILNPPILSLDKMPPKADLPPCIFHAMLVITLNPPFSPLVQTWWFTTLSKSFQSCFPVSCILAQFTKNKINCIASSPFNAPYMCIKMASSHKH
jgi:hypothetical protein